MRECATAVVVGSFRRGCMEAKEARDEHAFAIAVGAGHMCSTCREAERDKR